MPIFKTFVESTMKMADEYFPIELATMVQSEYSCGVTSYLPDHPCYAITNGMEGPCSISTSVNFATRQHVDIRDGSMSIFGWLEIGKPITSGYFLLSNMMVNVGGHDYKGIAIKLVDGLLVAADGRSIWHGTTANEFNGTMFGYQFAANGISMGSKLMKGEEE